MPRVGEPGTNVVVAGTSVHREAVVCARHDNPGWASKRYRSVVRWPDRVGPWAEWERGCCSGANP